MNPTPELPPTQKKTIFDPNHVQEVLTAAHPLRYGIHGDTHFIGELKTIVEQSKSLHDSLKVFLCEELDEMESNAARLDLHLVDHPHGGLSLTLHISPVHLGARAVVHNQRPAATPDQPFDSAAPVK